MQRNSAQPGTSARVYLTVLALLVGAIGLVTGAGGVWLIALGGSWYYAIAGIGMIACAILLLRRQMLGVWLYALIFGATVVWALWERGFGGWAQVPRLLGPAILLILILLIIPVLRGRATGRRSTGRVVAVAGIGMSLVAFIALAKPLVLTAQTVTASSATPQGTAVRPETAGADWAAYGGTHQAARYSSLDQITPENVATLEQVWAFRTGDMPSAASEGKYSPENTPLKVGDMIFVCSAMGIAIGIDAATGVEVWRHDPQVSTDAIPYGATCRGVAYHAAPAWPSAAPCAARIIWGTLDARLLAVDAKTGILCPDFGVGGTVDLTLGIGETVPGWYAVTSPPTIVRGVAIVGAQVKDGQAEDAPSGVVRGYDAVTGALVWAWDLGNPDATGAPPEGEVYTRGTPNMWTIATGDEALGLVYLPLGNSSVDYYGSQRSALENEHATSLVALDAATGRKVWQFQTVHNDVWDYDLGGQATLVDFAVGGEQVPALLLPTKQGDIHVLDRRTGAELVASEERPVPQGGVEPAYLSRTQPFSTYHTLAKRDLTEADMWGFTPIDQLYCRIQFRQAEYQGINTPPTTDQSWIQYPGHNGGSDWGGVAVDPVRGVIIANYNDMPNYNRLIPRAEADAAGLEPINPPRGPAETSLGEAGPQTAAPYAIQVNAGWRVPFTGILCKEPPYGGIRAIDLATGLTLWDRPLGTARKNGPFGIPSMLPLDIGTPNNGGAVITAGGLIFIAAATDDLFRAIDIATGETVWQVVLPAGGQSSPFAFEVGGRQLIGIMAGGHHFMETPIGDHVLAWALPL